MIKSIIFQIFCILLFVNFSFSQSYGEYGYQYLSPKPNAKHITNDAVIVVRLDQELCKDLHNKKDFIKVAGEKSGIHSGEIRISLENNTLNFIPDVAFMNGEIVQVYIYPDSITRAPARVKSFSYQFRVSSNPVRTEFINRSIDTSPKLNNNSANSKKALSASARIMENGVSVPSDFPHVNITVNNNPDSGFIFLNNWGPPNYNIIFENSGAPFWYWRTPDRRRDFKVQSNGWLTMLVRDGYGGSGEGYIALDQNYEYIRTFRTTNGYETDEHELQVLPDSGYFLIGRREEIVDMSQYVTGGKPNAIVRETCIQEYSSNDVLLLQFAAWNHFDIRDLELEDLTGYYIRFPHMNAIEIDDDGHILLSSRHLSEITKIHRQRGEIIWRMTGIPNSPNNDFQFINDPLNGFRNQHAIRSLGNGHYTIFDNGNLHNPPLSRAIEYVVDTLAMTATLVWEFQYDLSSQFSFYMGNAQRLPNDNTHINWARGDVMPIATEVTPTGLKAFEMWFVDGYHSYRTFRFPWNGIRNSPYLIIEPEFDNITLLFNKFGDKTVAYYKIYADTVSSPTMLHDTSTVSLKRLTNLENGKRYYFRITAVDSSGQESAYSNEENILVNIIQPGANLVANGNFSDALANWNWALGGSAIAFCTAGDSICHFNIVNGGNNIRDVRLHQNQIPLHTGNRYTLEFDAWADASRLIEVTVGEDQDIGINYSGIGFSSVTSTPNHYQYSFDMQHPTDLNSRLQINAGNSNINLYIDNISLYLDNASGIHDRDPVTQNYVLEQNFPNPFNPKTTIQYNLPERCLVRIEIFNVLGEHVQTLVNKTQSAGKYQFNFDASSYSSGIYFYQLTAASLNDGKNFSNVRKMMIIK
jgi:hypothetical protein